MIRSLVFALLLFSLLVGSTGCHSDTKVDTPSDASKAATDTQAVDTVESTNLSDSAEDLPPIEDVSDVLEIAHETRLTEEHLGDLSLRKLSLLRNAPFARRGYDFSTPWLSAYFRCPASGPTNETSHTGALLCEHKDETELTSLEKANVRTIKAFETQLGEDRLRKRWQELWDSYGGPPPEDEDWTLPGPFDHLAHRIEAGLLARALDRPRPDDPLFSEGETLPLPVSFDGLRLGEPAPTTTEDFAGREITHQVLGEGEIDIRIENGRIADIIFESPRELDALDPNPVYGKRYRQRFAAYYGAPDTTRELKGWTNEVAIWKMNEYRVEVGQYLEFGYPDVLAVMIRPDDPTRPCGPNDGIEEVQKGLEVAFRNKDLEAAADYFDFPFRSEGVSVFRTAEAASKHDRGHPFSDWVNGTDSTFGMVTPAEVDFSESAYCDPMSSEYIYILSPEGIAQRLYLHRIDGEWKVGSAISSG